MSFVNYNKITVTIFLSTLYHSLRSLMGCTLVNQINCH